MEKHLPLVNALSLSLGTMDNFSEDWHRLGGHSFGTLES